MEQGGNSRGEAFSPLPVQGISSCPVELPACFRPWLEERARPLPLLLAASEGGELFP